MHVPSQVLATFRGPSQGLPICHGPSLLHEILPSWSALAAVSFSTLHTPSSLSHPFLGSEQLHTILHPTTQRQIAKEEGGKAISPPLWLSSDFVLSTPH